MKICFLTSNHLPEARGGTEQVVAALEAAFREQGHEVFAITSSDVPHSGTDVRREEHGGVVVHRVFKHGDEWDHQGFVRPRILAIVRDLLERERPDLLHVHSTAALGSGCTTIAHQLCIPVAMTFHDLWVTCARYFRLPVAGITCPEGVDRTPCVACVDHELRAGTEHVERALAERDRVIRADVADVDLCTAPSATTARLVRECLPYDGEIEVVPHGLLRSIARNRPSKRREGAPLRIGTFGGLGPEKGLLELVAAVQGLPCELHLVGRHYGEEVAIAVEKLRLRGTSIVLGGQYTPADRHPARDLDLAVFPSKCQETYGLVVDEALAHGVPCVISDSGAYAGRAGDPGVVVTPLANLRETLQDLVSDPRKIAALRAAIPEQLPSITDAAARYLELYRQIA